MTDLIIGPALVLGCLIGLYEIFLIHRDTMAYHRLGHSIHAFALSIAFCFACMNVDFVFHLIPAIETIPLLGSVIVFRVAIGLIAAVKIHLVTKVIHGTGTAGVRRTSETWLHSFIIGGLIVATPYLYPFIEGMLPSWIKF